MPPESRIVVFGALADEPLQIDSKDFFFRDKKLEGFWLSRWIKTKGFLRRLLLSYKIQKLLPNELQTRIQARFPLQDILSALDLYGKQPPVTVPRQRGTIPLLDAKAQASSANSVFTQFYYQN